jgi:hypothetical protein
VIADENFVIPPMQELVLDDASAVHIAVRRCGTHAERQETSYEAHPFGQTGAGPDGVQRAADFSSPLSEDFLLIFPAATFLLLAALMVVLL